MRVGFKIRFSHMTQTTGDIMDSQEQEADLFHSIRIRKKGRAAERKSQLSSPQGCQCAWSGCENQGVYRAPKGRHEEGSYYFFCLQHVQAYNKEYNYFSDMDAEQFKAYQEAARTGHRPTWKLGARGAPSQRAARFLSARLERWGCRTEDDITLETRKRRSILPAHRHALKVLGLEEWATSSQIKTHYKEWLKRCHPDVNQGDRSSEKRLQEVINAYTLLKKAGFV